MKTRSLFIISIVCFVAGFSALLLYQQPATPSLAAAQISKQLGSELAKIEEAFKIHQDELKACEGMPSVGFPFYVYKKKELTCWTDNSLVPPINRISDTTSIQLLKIAQSNFVLYQKAVGSETQLVSLIMLTRDYPIQNDFLKNEWNHKIFPTNNITVLEPSSNLGVPVVYNNQVIFRVSFLLSGLSANANANSWSVIFTLIGVFFLLLTLHKWSYERYRESVAVIIMCSGIVAIRLFFLAFSYPRSVLPVDIFSAEQFASSRLNPSLGDLGLSVLTVCLLAIYIFQFAGRSLREKSKKEPGALTVIIGVIFSFLLFATAHYPVLTVQTIVHNSNISLDITSSLDLSFLRILSFLAVLLTWCASFLLIHVFIRFILLNCGKHSHRILLTGMMIFAAINYWEGQQFVATLLITWVILLLVQYFGFINSLDRIQYKTFSYVLVVLLGFVLNVSISVYFLSKEENADHQLRFAESYLNDRDSFGEFLLNDLSDKLEKDVFVQTRLASPFLSKLPIQQKIRQVFLPSYFNKYDVIIHLFNSVGNSVNVNDPSSFSTLLSQYDDDVNKTEYEGLYRVRNKGQDIAQQYVLVNAVKRNSILNGYIVIELLLKKSISLNVYPELLVDNRFRQSLKPAELSYATFARGELESSNGDFNYEVLFNKKLLGEEKLYRDGIEANGFQHIAIENADNLVTVISARIMSVQYFIANVSFYLSLGLCLVILLILWMGITNFIKRRQLYYAARIQLLINLSFFLPLVIVSIVTLRLLSTSSQQQLNETYLNRSVFLAEQLSNMPIQTDSLFRSVDKQSHVQNLSRVSSVELFLYTTAGRLAAASQMSIFDNQLMAPVMNAMALQKLNAGEKTFIEADEVGQLSYFMAYAKVPSTNLVLAIPYYQSATRLEKLQIEALVNILIIFGLVFLVLLFLSFFVSRWLTFPLEFISITLQRTSLDQFNKPLQWHANDEIGLMVKSYNDMLQKLNDSKSELERMQREQAWREIAQQVAHEIKNPLTPMKLTLQRLSRALQEKQAVSESATKAVDSLLEQVEVLNSIASSFSTFARLPAANLQETDLVIQLNRVMSLYDLNNAIVLESIPKKMLAIADPGIVQTVFSNIILNAIQAKHEDRELQVRISAEKSDGFWVLNFADNGRGIESEKIDKIFLPHFTTKESGSGLGLAIAKQSIEQMHGTISFQTNVESGTIFTITLRIAEELL